MKRERSFQHLLTLTSFCFDNNSFWYKGKITEPMVMLNTTILEVFIQLLSFGTQPYLFWQCLIIYFIRFRILFLLFTVGQHYFLCCDVCCWESISWSKWKVNTICFIQYCVVCSVCCIIIQFSCYFGGRFCGYFIFCKMWWRKIAGYYVGRLLFFFCVLQLFSHSIILQCGELETVKVNLGSGKIIGFISI